MKKIIDKLKALSDEKRLYSFALIYSSKKPLCICEVERITQMKQYNVSRVVSALKNADLVEEVKHGKFKLLRILECSENRKIIEMVSPHIDSDQIKRDLKSIESFIKIEGRDD